jgi:hypothetical protein
MTLIEHRSDPVAETSLQMRHDLENVGVYKNHVYIKAYIIPLKILSQNLSII